jgi:uncharacterized protein YyaL (SSP411 family)
MNRLATEASLYLRQHADNPVDWYAWGDEAFDRAVADDKPVLLSVGYSSCHWCHVMAHESFENPDIAAVMNELFVCIKVDREERPDVDALYMQATLGLTGSGGWPMTVFLTPDARPFFAGTYFPPEPRQGMPGFPELLRHVADAYRLRKGDVEHTASQLSERLAAAANRTPSPDALDRRTVDDAVTGLAMSFDPAQGGFGGAPKFPPHLALEFLLRRIWADPKDHNARQMVETTLHRMADGGIHDQVGGGFHRYSVDAIWLVPHFEKMLYDNALLARVYTLAHRVTQEPRWREVAERTLDYLLREMQAPGGGFAAAQDADSPGGEGAFFVWTVQQLTEILTRDEAQAIVLRFGMRPEGNFEGANILHVAAPIEMVAERVGPDAGLLVASALGKLYAARSARPAPARDDKVVASWNGLAIAAFADAGVWLGRRDYIEVAARTAAFMLDNLVVDGRLHRVWAAGSANHLGCLDDFADLAVGLLSLYDATFEPRWLVAARELAAQITTLFGDEDGAGFYFAGSDGEALIARTRDIEDHPTPGGNSQAALVLRRLAAITCDEDMAARSDRALQLVGDDMARYPQAFGTALVALDTATSPNRVEIAVVGTPADDATTALVAAARAAAGPSTTLVVGDPDDAAAVAAAPLLAGRQVIDGRAAAYVCRNFTCDAPVTDAAALTAALDRLQGT